MAPADGVKAEPQENSHEARQAAPGNIQPSSDDTPPKALRVSTGVSSVRLQASPAVHPTSSPALKPSLRQSRLKAPELVILLSDDESSRVNAEDEAAAPTGEVNSQGHAAAPSASQQPLHSSRQQPPLKRAAAPPAAAPRRSLRSVKPEPVDCSIDDQPIPEPAAKRRRHGAAASAVKPEPAATAVKPEPCTDSKPNLFAPVKPEPFADAIPPASAKPEPFTDAKPNPAGHAKPEHCNNAEAAFPPEQKPSTKSESVEPGEAGFSDYEFRHPRVMHLFRMQERLVAMGARALAEEAERSAGVGVAADGAAHAADAEGAGQDEAEEVSGDTFAEYWPAKVKIGVPHPDPVVETASLAGVQPPDPTFRLKIAGERDPAVLAGREELQHTAAGNLSCLQLEAVTYACQRHEQFLQGGQRAGFLLGDGAGMGKGRTVAAIIVENWLRGRKRHLWVSIGPDLKLDAERDLQDMGGHGIEVHALNKKAYGSLASKGVKEGVLFCSYSTLIASKGGRGGGTRLDQIVQWCGGSSFEGTITFDEAHKAKNLVPEGKIGKGTKTGQAVLEIQEKLPNARVVYCSATGASEARHLGYMTRMGLWGPGTAFSNVMALLSAIEKRGMAVLELLAMDMKARGMYVCRTLSFRGASFEVTHVAIEGDMERMYWQASKFWADLKADFQQALVEGGHLEKVEGRKRPPCWGIFWAAHQRFFSIMCMASKVPAAARLAQAALAAGKCVVIGLQSTGEARTDGVVERCGTELDDWVSGPREMLLKLVHDFYPLPYDDTGGEGALDSGDEGEMSAASSTDDEAMRFGLPPSTRAQPAAASPPSDSLQERLRYAQLLNADSPAQRESQGSYGGPASQGSPVQGSQGSGKYTGSAPCSVCNARTQYGKKGILQHCGSCCKIAHKKCFLELERKAPQLKPTVPEEFKCKSCVASLGIRGCEYRGIKPCSGCSSSDAAGHRGKLYRCSKCTSITHASCVPAPNTGAAGGASQGSAGAVSGAWECSCCTGVPEAQTERMYWGHKNCGECSERERTSTTRGSLLQCSMCQQVAHKKCFESQRKETGALGPSWSCLACQPPPAASRAPPRDASIFDPAPASSNTPGGRMRIALLRKAKILEAIQALELPNNPLDDLVDRLGGPDAVAEMTGRKGMIVRKEEGLEVEEGEGGQRSGTRFVYQQRKARGGASLDMLNIKEKEAFMAGDKLVAIISDAASVGISLQADRRVANQRRRVHITLELPWSADKAIQQFGRSHRSNQVSAPEYHVLFTELGGEKRFASTVASRLESLGALTQGDRRASGLSLHEFNYNSVYGSKGLDCMYRHIMGGNGVCPVPPPGCQPHSRSSNFYDDLPEDWELFFESARAALLITDVIKEDEDAGEDFPFWAKATGQGEEDAICTTRGEIKRGSDVKLFLNRLLGLSPGVQRALFHFFSSLYAHKVKEAKDSGQYDMGLMCAHNARLSARPCELFVDPTSGAQAFLYSFKRDRGLNWEAANKALQDSLAHLAAEEEGRQRDRAQAQARAAAYAGMGPPGASPAAAAAFAAAKEEVGEAETKVAAGQIVPAGVIYVDFEDVVREPSPESVPQPHAASVKPEPGLSAGAPGPAQAAPGFPVKPEPGLASGAAPSPFAGPSGTGVKGEPGLGVPHTPAYAAYMAATARAASSSGAGPGVKPEPFVRGAQFPPPGAPASTPAGGAKPEPMHSGSRPGAVPGEARSPGAAASPKPLDGFYLSINVVPPLYRKLPMLVVTKGVTQGWVHTMRPYDREPKRLLVSQLREKYSRDRSKDCRQTAVEWEFQYRQRVCQCQHGSKCRKGEWCSQGRRILPLQLLSGAIFPIWSATDVCYQHEYERKPKFRVIQVAVEEGSASSQHPAAPGASGASGAAAAGGLSVTSPGAGGVAGASAGAASRSVVGIKLMPETAFSLKGVLEAQKAKKEGRPTTADAAQEDVLKALNRLEQSIETEHAIHANSRATNKKKRRGRADDYGGPDEDEYGGPGSKRSASP